MDWVETRRTARQRVSTQPGVARIQLPVELIQSASPCSRSWTRLRWPGSRNPRSRIGEQLEFLESRIPATGARRVETHGLRLDRFFELEHVAPVRIG